MTTVFCIGRNYEDHAKELGNVALSVSDNPLVFLKSENSIRGLNPSPMAFAHEVFHHEVELVFRVGKQINLNSQGPLVAYLDGLTLVLDLTRREEQNKLKAKGHPWTTAKSFLGSAVVAEWIPLTRDMDLESFEFSLLVNGEVRQHGHSKNMTFSLEHILRYLSNWNELQKGDLIFTGTPAGVGPIKVGDEFNLDLKDLGNWRGKL